MTTPSNPIRVEFSSQFLKDTKRLRQKHRAIDGDLRKTIAAIKSGQTPGEQVPGVGYPAFKERVRSTNMKRGKKGGFRVIYYFQLKDTAVMLTTFAKSERDNITAAEIRALIEEHERASG